MQLRKIIGFLLLVLVAACKKNIPNPIADTSQKNPIKKNIQPDLTIKKHDDTTKHFPVQAGYKILDLGEFSEKPPNRANLISNTNTPPAEKFTTLAEALKKQSSTAELIRAIYDAQTKQWVALCKDKNTKNEVGWFLVRLNENGEKLGSVVNIPVQRFEVPLSTDSHNDCGDPREFFYADTSLDIKDVDGDGASELLVLLKNDYGYVCGQRAISVMAVYNLKKLTLTFIHEIGANWQFEVPTQQRQGMFEFVAHKYQPDGSCYNSEEIYEKLRCSQKLVTEYYQLKDSKWNKVDTISFVNWMSFLLTSLGDYTYSTPGETFCISNKILHYCDKDEQEGDIGEHGIYLQPILVSLSPTKISIKNGKENLLEDIMLGASFFNMKNPQKKKLISILPTGKILLPYLNTYDNDNSPELVIVQVDQKTMAMEYIWVYDYYSLAWRWEYSALAPAGCHRIFPKTKNKFTFFAELVCENQTVPPGTPRTQVTIRPGKPWISKNISTSAPK